MTAFDETACQAVATNNQSNWRIIAAWTTDCFYEPKPFMTSSARVRLLVSFVVLFSVFHGFIALFDYHATTVGSQ